MARHGNRIVVPQRQVQGGLDFKFETDPYDVNLHGLLTRDQYTDAINAINDRLRPGRSGRFDGVLLAAGPLIVPLAWWGIRHRNQTKKRKRLLQKAIAEFNGQYPELYMRWNRRPESKLTIERKPPNEEAAAQPQQEPHVMAEAEFVSDVIAHTQPVPSTSNNNNNNNNAAAPASRNNAAGHSMV